MSHFSVRSAYCAAGVAAFLGDTTESILGTLTAKSVFSVEPAQRDAWIGQVETLRTALVAVDGTLFLEFDVPRVGSRIDAALIAGPTVFVIEFKVGEARFKTADYNQAWDYALVPLIYFRATWPSRPARVSVPTKSPRKSVRVVWVRSIGRVTRNSIATSRSKSSLIHSPAIRTGSRDSHVKRRPWRP